MDKDRSSAVVEVGGVPVADASREKVIELASEPAGNAPRLVYAMHVGGLLLLKDSAYLEAMNGADLVYADGAAVVMLGRAAGGRLDRAPTTDIGRSVIAALAVRLMRPARVALVGGPPGLAEKVVGAIEADGDAEVVLCAHGYFDDDTEVLGRLWTSEPDIIVLGLGMPREALWSYARRAALPPAVVLTCGGWFGFLAGEERRAPAILRATGFEWTYRLGQHFPRLIGRYSRGLLAVLRLLPGQLRSRVRAGR